MQSEVFRDVDKFYDRAAKRSPKITKRLGWNGPRLRRWLYGLPHEYRFGPGRERRQLMSVFLGFQFVVATGFGLLAVLLLYLTPDQHPSKSTWRLMGLMSIGSMSASILLLGPPWKWGRGHFAPPIHKVLVLHALLLFGGALVAIFCFFMGPYATAGSFFFLWGSAYSFTFFSHWLAVTYIAFAEACLFVALWHNDVAQRAGVVALHTGASILIGAALGIVVSREWSFRDDLRLSLLKKNNRGKG